MNISNYESLEFNKVLLKVSEFACLEQTKQSIINIKPSSELTETKTMLDMTSEADKLLYLYGVGGIEFFSDVDELLKRAKFGSSLSMGELLKVNSLLRSSRLLKTSVMRSEFEDIVLLKRVCNGIYYDVTLENEIKDKIYSEDKISDNASEKLAAIRKKINIINNRIREKLSSYLTKYSKILQDNIITMRGDRYVIPVKVENKGMIRGFIHDQSSSGATVFIEPEHILELNNDLKSEMFAEKIEIDRILSELSKSVGNIAGALELNIEYISIVDSFYARAIYSYKNKSVKPEINNKGIIEIIKGRHPLIDAEKVIPLSFKLGETNNFLLISGPNTGGKTVSLKMTGLFSLMAMCGIFIPCVSSNISVFEEIFCDIGDLQSIENNLSTFSSHIKSLKNITENVNENSLVLIDELGDGTDPDEGQALALSVIEFLIEQKCKGIITTHFSSLKEFAFNNSAIKNASMEFDMQTLTPLYKVIEGIPGSSNAIAISKRLGLDSKIIERAKSYLSLDKISFENILNKAEETRINAERELSEIQKTKNEIEEIKKELINEKERLKNEREKIALSSRIEIRRIINDKADEAEELLDKIKEIFDKQEYDSGDIILAKTLKNKLLEKKYFAEDNETVKPDIKLVESENIKTGLRVYIKSLDNYGIISNISNKKKEAEIFIGNIRYTCRFNDIYYSDMNNNNKEANNKKNSVLKQSISSHQPLLEINVLGKNVIEAIDEVDAFIDKAIMDSLNEIKVIHGVGTGKLRLEIRKHLKSHPNVESFRAGKYGEGENGVTFITLK